MAQDRGAPDRLPPQNIEAERSVLGSLLRDNDVINDVSPLLHSDHFYADAHRKIYEAIRHLYEATQKVDTVLLAEELNRRGHIQDIGGYGYLGELWDAAPSAANAVYYAKIVREKAVIRNLIHAGTEILRDAYDQAQPAEELVQTAERKIFELSDLGSSGEATTLSDALAQAYDRIDERNRGESMSISGLSTGFTDLDEITAGLQNRELVIIAARPSVGKCLADTSEILLADGSVVTVEEIYRRRQARLLTLNDNFRLEWTEPSAYLDEGHKPVFRVTTRLGRRIETTASHPFLTFDGWRPLAEIGPGQRIAVPRRLPVFGTQPMRECEIKILAYLIGDGCLTDMVPEFTNGNPRLRADFAGAVAEFGAVKVRYDDSGGTRTASLNVSSDPAFIAEHRAEFGRRLRQAVAGRFPVTGHAAPALGVTREAVRGWIEGKSAPGPEKFGRICDVLGVRPEDLAPCGIEAVRKNGKNPLTLWLERLGLWGKESHGKFIPAPIFRLPRPQLALFLNRLFATDGWATVLTGGGTQLGYASVSERLARQIQHLLLRFGVIAALRRRMVKYRDERRESWQLDVTDPVSIRTFLDEVGIFGKEEAAERVRQGLDGRQKLKTNRDVIPVAVWDRLAEAKGAASWASVAAGAGLPNGTNMHVHSRGLSRARLLRLATAVADESLQKLARSDVYWDEIVSVEPVGVKQVYDLTIPRTHNFVANDVCVHNTAFALALIRNIAVDGGHPVFFASLEQSRIELAERLLCCQSRVESHKLRKGNLTADDMAKLIAAGGTLRNAPVFIDDVPGQSMLRIAANARRLAKRHALKLVVIDYLQLIEPENRRDPRQEQVAQISKRLKHLAREIEIPVVALAQVNRASEDRQDHRPRLADLRESGCLAGETLVTLADTGARVPIRELVGRPGVRVWALDEVTFKLKPAEVSRAFATGRKPVCRLTTRLGRTVRATPNHRFRAFDGWRRLDELRPGDRIALPRSVPCAETTTMRPAEVALLGHLIGDGCTLPRHAIQYTTREEDLARTVAALAGDLFGARVEPRIRRERRWYQVYLAAADHLTHGRRNPVAEWLDGLGAFGLRSWEKRVPEPLFRQSAEMVGAFLRHLWSTDGCVRPPGENRRAPAIYYASSSENLARDVQSLLLRLGINAVLRSYDQKGKGRRQFHVLVMGREEVLQFADAVGAVGEYKSNALAECREFVARRKANTNCDVIPAAFWRRHAVPALERQGMSSRTFQKAIGMAFMGTGLYRQNVSRSRLGRVATVIDTEPILTSLARSDVYWDEIVEIRPDGAEDVYDLTVPGPSNFIAADLVVHNSIEQDADTVMMLHRPDRYEPGQREGEIEVIVAKQRNGPTGEIVLSYIKQFFRFEDRAIDSHFAP